jgi:hypothetical protein
MNMYRRERAGKMQGYPSLAGASLPVPVAPINFSVPKSSSTRTTSVT